MVLDVHKPMKSRIKDDSLSSRLLLLTFKIVFKSLYRSHPDARVLQLPLPQKLRPLERHTAVHHWSESLQTRVYLSARASGPENVDAVSECIESPMILFCRFSKLATRCREAGLVPITPLVRGIAAFGMSSFI